MNSCFTSAFRRFAALLFIALLPTAAIPSATAKPSFQLNGQQWTYTSEARTFSGYLVKPDGEGPFPAVIINHGKGGRPDHFSLNWAREMAKWGLVGICPTLTHVAGTDIQGQEGASAENIARAEVCLSILADLGYVDMNRVAVTGHSMGAYLTIGFAGTVGSRIKAAAISAGGANARPDVPMPHVDLAAKITAPVLILHGTADPAVAYSASVLLNDTLTAKNIPSRHVTFLGMDHSLPTNPATRDVVLTLIREWFAAQGVLDTGANTAPALTPPPDTTLAASDRESTFPFTVGDRETAPAKLRVTAATSNPEVLPPAHLELGGSRKNRTLTVKRAPGQAGPVTVFLTVSDGERMTTRSFSIGFANENGAVPEPVIKRRSRPSARPNP